MGVEDGVCLGVCVCLFLFVVEIDTWKRVCLFVCLRIEAGDCFLSFLCVHEIIGSVHRKYFFSLSIFSQSETMGERICLTFCKSTHVSIATIVQTREDQS